MNWNIKYLPEALEDLRKLDGSQKILVRKAIQKACKNPLPENEGGYGKPLGKNNKTNLSGFLKIKLRGAGLRIVYQIVRHGDLHHIPAVRSCAVRERGWSINDQPLFIGVDY